MNTITRLISIVLLCLASVGSYANHYIDSIIVSPAPITKNDSVRIRLYTNIGTHGHQVYLNYTITPGNIWISSCYKLNMAATHVYFADTLDIGKLPEGKYKLNYVGYVSLDSQCTSIFDSTKVLDSFTVHSPQAITHPTQNAAVSIFPNPAYDIVSINTPHDWEIQSITLTDITGAVVSQRRNNTGKMDISLLPKGCYFIRIRTSDRIISQKVIKL